MNRKWKVMLNIFARWLNVVLIAVFQLLSRRIFIIYFSDDLLGLSSLLNSVISMLSLLELGIGSAINYSLYDPLAKGDNEKTILIMQLYRKVYKIIGILVLIIGVVLLPWIGYFVYTSIDITVVRLAYLILLSDTVFSYFLAYRRNIVNANQNEYFTINVDTCFSVLALISQIFIVIFTNNYYLFLAVKVLWSIVANVVIFLYTNVKYSFINKKINKELPKQFMTEFKANVKSLFIVNISSYLVFGTDNLLISKYVGLATVFIYSNYHLIISSVNKVFHKIFDSMLASVGNYLVTNTREESYELFNNILFANYIITCYTTVSLITCCNEFVLLWLGKEYTLSPLIVVILVLNNYLRFIGQTISVFRNAAGLYNPYGFYKYWSLIEGIVNLVVSLLLVYLYPVNTLLGICLGTTISTVFVFSTVGAHALFKYYFGIDKLNGYIKKYALYFLLTATYCFISICILNIFRSDNVVMNLLVAVAVSFIIPNCMNYIIFKNDKSLLYFKKIIYGKLLLNSEKEKENQ